MCYDTVDTNEIDKKKKKKTGQYSVLQRRLNKLWRLNERKR